MASAQVVQFWWLSDQSMYLGGYFDEILPTGLYESAGKEEGGNPWCARKAARTTPLPGFHREHLQRLHLNSQSNALFSSYSRHRFYHNRSHDAFGTSTCARTCKISAWCTAGILGLACDILNVDSWWSYSSPCCFPPSLLEKLSYNHASIW